MALISLQTGVNKTNTYIVFNHSEAVVIDPGAQARQILWCAKEQLVTIKHILITHAHYDHVGAVAELKELLEPNDVKVYMSKTDTALYNEICTVGEDFYVRPFDVDVQISGGTTLELIGSKFRVISTPGHTPGSVCFLQDDSCIYSGDTLFRLSVGRTDFIGGDRNAQIASLKKLFALKKNYAVFPGHGEPTMLFFERENNPYAN